MIAPVDATHDPALQSWVESANTADTDFPIQNLPFGRFRLPEDPDWRIGVGIGDHVLDLRRAGLIESVNGCALSNGDVFGTGTLSGPRPEQAGSLLELTDGGKRAVSLSNGEQRTFLQDGDSVMLRAVCERAGRRRIGFGACRGTVLAP